MRLNYSTNTDTPASPVVLRDVSVADLAKVNHAIAAAIETWDIAPRIKRLASPLLQYKDDDFLHLGFIGAWRGDELLGFVSFEPANSAEAPETRSAMLIHGLYVLPERHGEGVGSRLINAAKWVAHGRGFSGLIVRAERNARAYFAKRGFAPLPIEDHQRDYPHRLWAAIDPLDAGATTRQDLAVSDFSDADPHQALT